MFRMMDGGYRMTRMRDGVAVMLRVNVTSILRGVAVLRYAAVCASGDGVRDTILLPIPKRGGSRDSTKGRTIPIPSCSRTTDCIPS